MFSQDPEARPTLEQIEDLEFYQQFIDEEYIRNYLIRNVYKTEPVSQCSVKVSNVEITVE